MWKNIPPSRLAVIIPTRQTGNKLLLKDGPMIKWGERKLCEHKINLVFRYKVTICHPPLFPVQIKATHFLNFFYWTRKMTLKHLDVLVPKKFLLTLPKSFMSKRSSGLNRSISRMLNCRSHVCRNTRIFFKHKNCKEKDKP